jgi:hypothetical protein
MSTAENVTAAVCCLSLLCGAAVVTLTKQVKPE